MITIFIHIPSLIIGIIIGYIMVSLFMLFFTRFEATDFQRGYTDGVLDTERKYANERTEETESGNKD